MRQLLSILIFAFMGVGCSWAQTVGIFLAKDAGVRECYAAEYLQGKLSAMGFQPIVKSEGGKVKKSDYSVHYRMLLDKEC